MGDGVWDERMDEQGEILSGRWHDVEDGEGCRSMHLVERTVDFLIVVLLRYTVFFGQSGLCL